MKKINNPYIYGPDKLIFDIFFRKICFYCNKGFIRGWKACVILPGHREYLFLCKVCAPTKHVADEIFNDIYPYEDCKKEWSRKWGEQNEPTQRASI